MLLLQIPSRNDMPMRSGHFCNDFGPRGSDDKRPEGNNFGMQLPYAVPMFSQTNEGHVGTPDFQIAPYLVQGGHVIGGTTPIPMHTATSGASGYGYGSWSAMYPPSHGLTTPSNIENTQNGVPRNDAAIPASNNLFSSSPPYYQNPLLSVSNNLAALSLGGSQPPPQGANLNRTDQPYPGMAGSPGFPTIAQPPQLMYMQFNQAPTQAAAPSLSSSPNFFGNAIPPLPAPHMGHGMQGFNNSRVSLFSTPTPSTNSGFSLAHNRRRNEDLSGRQTKRSHLLDDFRNNRTPHLQITDIISHVVEFAKDQHGSRFIQQKLERASAKEKQLLFDEVLVNAHALMVDANSVGCEGEVRKKSRECRVRVSLRSIVVFTIIAIYLFQKFFEYGTPEQKMALGRALKGDVMSLALQMYGCRVIQKALESVDEAIQLDILKELESQVLKCVKDQNGNHVVQKVIEKVKPERLQFIIDTFMRNGPDTVSHLDFYVVQLSMHPYGCRVIQRVLEHCTEEQKRPVLEALHANVRTLVLDQYGNYVIQHVIEHGSDPDRDRIVREITGNVLRYAQHKFASNVIEKCLMCASPHHKTLLINEVCGDTDDPTPPILLMMKDQFANYVVQRMLDTADPVYRRKMVYAIKPHIPVLRKFSYGKHIISKFFSSLLSLWHRSIGVP
ncbi:unnamed protein product [Nippostrongylus brasiliensis]|uniref:PUM-HD domain-containing protein n=1 Tax=Nippostrongylus brasiliensis TaxID=27835 RepID=A0A0N4Y499_NIPBR|nr:unnamed protein product [Nippostrongylus brasiliensis]